MKTDLEKFKELFDSVGMSYEYKEESDEIEILIDNVYAYHSITFDLTGKFKKSYVSDC